jgi:hypothetical protein
VDYADTIMALARTAMGWMSAKPHVVRDLFINVCGAPAAAAAV